MTWSAWPDWVTHLVHKLLETSAYRNRRSINGFVKQTLRMGFEMA